MKPITYISGIIFLTSFAAISLRAQSNDTSKAPAYDAELANKLGADERGMKMYVLCILKTGPQDAEIKGKERDDIFAGHRLTDRARSAFGDNRRRPSRNQNPGRPAQ